MRRLVIVLATLAPAPALAEVCDKERPGWTPGTDATVWGEAIHHLSTLPSLALIFATMLAIRFRSQWGGLIVALGWTALVSFVAFTPPDEIRLQAINEGCIASPGLFIGIVAAICVGMILYTAPLSRQPTE